LVDFTKARDDLDAILLDDLVSFLVPKVITLEDLRAVDVRTCDVLSGYLLSFIAFVDFDATTAVVFDTFFADFTNDRDDRDANSLDDIETFLADLDACLADLINDRDDRDANSAEDLDTFFVVFDMTLDDRDANSLLADNVFDAFLADNAIVFDDLDPILPDFFDLNNSRDVVVVANLSSDTIFAFSIMARDD
jgi:hypothetical protein